MVTILLGVAALLFQDSSPSTSWTVDGAPTALAWQAIALLGQAGAHGLVPADYEVAHLEESAARLASRPAAPEERTRFEARLGTSFIRYLTDVHRGRIDPRRAGFDYHAGEGHRLSELLTQALASGDLAGAVAEVQPAFAQYDRLKTALAHYRALSAEPTLEPIPVVHRLAPGDTYPGRSRLSARLRAMGDLAQDVATGEDGIYDIPLVQAVKRFQARHGLTADGILGPATFHALNVPLHRRVRQIELALERLRWLPHAPAGRFVVANVPAFRLVAFDSATSERPSLQTGIVVGRAARTRTPLFADAIRHVIFRPFWYPPRSIIVKEMLPALRRNPRYLAAERLELVQRGDDQAMALPATAANLSRLAAGSVQLRQRSGPHNALGLVKFVFPNRYDVYLHDTPAKGLFARARRDFSHGCIRVENPAGLAAFVLADRSEWTADRISSAMNGERTQRVDLPTPVPVFIYYTTVIIRVDGTIEFFEDIYGKDESLDRALRALNCAAAQL